MIPVYRTLVSLHLRGRADFSNATTFNLDEFVGASPGDEGSYRAFMRRCLFDAVNVSRHRTHFPGEQGSSPSSYDDMISAAGGIDLCLVGIGMNGHLGFNEPAARLTPRTHRVRLMPATRRANAYLFDGRLREVPRLAHSMESRRFLMRGPLCFSRPAPRRRRSSVARSGHDPRVRRLDQTHPKRSSCWTAAAGTARR